jgi:hypothetical protein
VNEGVGNGFERLKRVWIIKYKVPHFGSVQGAICRQEFRAKTSLNCGDGSPMRGGNAMGNVIRIDYGCPELSQALGYC